MTIANVKVHLDATAVHITVTGEIDLANAAAIEDEILTAVRNTATKVVVDLTDLLYIDSSGLRILFLLAGMLKVLQIAMEVIAPPGTPIRRVILISGLDGLVDLRP
jgi:stage II sporulation protein AA (anti-sigma F factor antagonist)